MIAASTRYELKKRYAGSAVGGLWLFAFPLMFLGCYVFVWTFVFPGQVRGFEGARYVVFVFSGLVPYLFAMDVANSSVVVVRQNIHMIKGLILSADQLPTRSVAAGLFSHGIGLGILAAVLAITNSFSPWILLLPFVVALYVVFLLGLAWSLAPLGLIVPDLSYTTALVFTLLAFLSPISFTPDMVPASVSAIVLLNPFTYAIEAYRLAVLGPEHVALWRVGVFVVLSGALFAIGGTFCARFKDHVLDFE